MGDRSGLSSPQAWAWMLLFSDFLLRVRVWTCVCTHALCTRVHA